MSHLPKLTFLRSHETEQTQLSPGESQLRSGSPRAQVGGPQAPSEPSPAPLSPAEARPSDTWQHMASGHLHSLHRLQGIMVWPTFSHRSGRVGWQRLAPSRQTGCVSAPRPPCDKRATLRSLSNLSLLLSFPRGLPERLRLLNSLDRAASSS